MAPPPLPPARRRLLLRTPVCRRLGQIAVQVGFADTPKGTRRGR